MVAPVVRVGGDLMVGRTYGSRPLSREMYTHLEGSVPVSRETTRSRVLHGKHQVVRPGGLLRDKAHQYPFSVLESREAAKDPSVPSAQENAR